MEPYFLDKHLKYKSKITEDFYLFVQPVSSEHNFVGKGGDWAMPPISVRLKPN